MADSSLFPPFKRCACWSFCETARKLSSALAVLFAPSNGSVNAAMVMLRRFLPSYPVRYLVPRLTARKRKGWLRTKLQRQQASRGPPLATHISRRCYDACEYFNHAQSNAHLSSHKVTEMEARRSKWQLENRAMVVSKYLIKILKFGLILRVPFTSHVLGGMQIAVKGVSTNATG